MADCISEHPFLRWHNSMVFVLLLVQSKGSLRCKTIFLKTFGNLYVYSFIEICAVPVMESAESGGTIAKSKSYKHYVETILKPDGSLFIRLYMVISLSPFPQRIVFCNVTIYGLR